MALDPTDLKILTILQQDSKVSHASIAEKVGIKAPSVFERVKKLEARGVIQGYTVLLNSNDIGKILTAFIYVTIVGGPDYIDEAAIVEELSKEPSIEECHVVAGEAFYLLKVRVSAPQELQELISRLRRIKGVSSTRTTVVLSTPLDRPGPSII